MAMALMNKYPMFKGTVSRCFPSLFILKTLYLAPYKQTKTVLQTFGFREDIQLQSFTLCVRVVNDYASRDVCLLNISP